MLAAPLFFAGVGLWLALAPAPARVQDPLFAFAQFSDVQANEPVEIERFDQVLDAIGEAGEPGALLPHPVSVVFIAGDLVNLPQSETEWEELRDTLQEELTDQGIPFLAVPGNRDQDEFGTPLYQEHIAPAGVWDVSSAQFVGQNGVVTTTGWQGLRFVGVNSSWAGGNSVRPADLAQLGAIVSSSAAAGENVFLVSHYPHDGEGALPLAALLETPGVVGYLRGHEGLPHATQGLAGIANPVWDLSSESVMRDAALIYYEVFATEIRAYVLLLVQDPPALPPPAVLTLPQPLWPAVPGALPRHAWRTRSASSPAPSMTLELGSGSGVGSQGSPAPSESVSVWSSFATPGQLSRPSRNASRSRLIPIRVPEPGGTAVKVSGPSLAARPRRLASSIDPPTSSRKRSLPLSSTQPRRLPPTLPLAIRSHSVTVPPRLSESKDWSARSTRRSMRSAVEDPFTAELCVPAVRRSAPDRYRRRA